jgi:cell division protein FtsL
MAERSKPFQNIRFIVRPGPKKLKILFVALILACAVALVALSMVRGSIRQRTQEVLDQAAVLEHENAELAEKADDLGTGSSIKDIAREELGMVDPGTIIIDPKS